MRLNFGKYKGLDVEDVPYSYLRWLYSATRETLDGLKTELKNRGATFSEDDAKRESADSDFQFSPLAQQVFEEGFRAMAHKVHPDKGGDVRKMQALNELREQFRQAR